MNAHSENIPLDDGACQVVFVFSSLDHAAGAEKFHFPGKAIRRLL
jgi:hypothetical protein